MCNMSNLQGLLDSNISSYHFKWKKRSLVLLSVPQVIFFMVQVRSVKNLQFWQGRALIQDRCFLKKKNQNKNNLQYHANRKGSGLYRQGETFFPVAIMEVYSVYKCQILGD